MIEEMVITKTPFRMSFFGGGTDIPEFFNEYGGAVLSTTFDKYCCVCQITIREDAHERTYYMHHNM